MGKRKSAKKPKRDPFDEHVEGVEFENEPETIERYLADWRAQLRILAVKRTTGKPLERARKAVARRGLFHIECIEVSSNPTYVFIATVELGACLRELGIVENKIITADKAGRGARKILSKWTTQMASDAVDIFAELPTRVRNNEDQASKRIQISLVKDYGHKQVGISTIKRRFLNHQD